MYTKEPVALYIFRFVLGFGLFAFMAMLYWSSLLLEVDMQNLKNSMQEIHDQLSILNSTSSVFSSSTPPVSPLLKRNETLSSSTSQIDPALANLLTEDLFYETTLPRLLGKDFKPHGIRRDAAIGVPKNLHPFSNWANVAAWNNACTGSVSQMKFGIYETLAPNFAYKMEQRPRKDSTVPEFWIHLRKDIFWLPLRPSLFPKDVVLAPHFLQAHQVTAHDFKFYYDATMNPFVQEAGAVGMRNFLIDMEEIEVIDDFTFVVRWKPHKIPQADGTAVERIPYTAKLVTGALRPLASFVFQYFPDGSKIIEDDADPSTYLKNSVWAQNFSQHWARNVIPSCGPWEFNGLNEERIQFKRNEAYYNPLETLVNEERIAIKESPENIWQDFKAGKLDSYTLRPDQVLEWKNFSQSEEYKKQKQSTNSIKSLEYLTRNYVYIGWNMARPQFKSEKVRQAMTMAIDREAIIKHILNGMGAPLTGPFYVNSDAYDSSIIPWPYDPQTAKRLLEEEGWFENDTQGRREKVIDGKVIPFEFSLTYFVKNPTTQSICTYVATALKKIGVECVLHAVDLTDLAATFDDKNFDALCMGWALGTPPEDPRQLWHSSGAMQKGSSNGVGFANAEADQIIEALQFEDDKEKRQQLYHRFHAIIHKEAPYTFLYIPKAVFLYREYLQNVFIPSERQDLIPGADVDEPQPNIFWIRSA